jgi:hypothetical protein
VHDAVGVEFEGKLVPVMGKDAEEGFEVLRGSK